MITGMVYGHGGKDTSQYKERQMTVICMFIGWTLVVANSGGIRSTVVAIWTTGQQIERSCTWGMIHIKIHLISSGFPQTSIALQCRIVA